MEIFRSCTRSKASRVLNHHQPRASRRVLLTPGLDPEIVFWICRGKGFQPREPQRCWCGLVGDAVNCCSALIARLAAFAGLSGSASSGSPQSAYSCSLTVGLVSPHLRGCARSLLLTRSWSACIKCPYPSERPILRPVPEFCPQFA